MEKPKDIELRSEKIKNIIGQIPSFLIRYGNTLLCVVLVILIGAAVYIPFPYKVHSSIYLETIQKGATASNVRVQIPLETINRLLEAKDIYFTLSIYPDEIFVPIRIDSVSSAKKIINQTLYQQVFVRMDTAFFIGREELRKINTPVKGSAVLNFPPQTFVERFCKRAKK